MENIPVRVNEHGQRAHEPNGLNQGPQRKPKKARRAKPLLVSILAIVILAGLVIIVLTLARQLGGDTAIDKSKYQAVFLSNGQVYFGKLQNSSGEYLKLTNVFYLQTKTDTATQNPQKTAADGANVELIKLGSEIHGPDDQMVISRTQVLFYENLKPDGRVSQSITNYVKK